MLRTLFSLLIATAISAHAQSVSAVAAGVGNAQPQTAGSISIAFDNVPLEDAVRTIARRSGRVIAFVPNMLPDKRISYRAANISPETALAEILRGTNVSVRPGPEGSLGLVRRSDKSPAQGVVAGRVTDGKTGHGISGATISLGSEARSVVSGDDGFYRLTGVPAGVRTVSVRLVGYAKQTRTVTVGEGATVTADFKLEPSASVLDQVVVTGTVIATELKAVPNAITVVTAKQIEDKGITRIDQLFRGDIPGLFSMNLGSNAMLDEVTMFSRGATALVSGVTGSAGTTFNTNPIKTYIDGVEMADSKYLSQIDPKSIERIEILTGPQASTIYGANAINGVMQIFTKRGVTGRPRISTTVSTGVTENNFNSRLAPSHTVDASVSGMEGRISYNVGGSWNYIGAWTPSKRTERLGANGGGRTEWRKLTLDMSARRSSTRNRQTGDQAQTAMDFREAGVWYAASAGTSPALKIQNALGQTLGLSATFRPLSWWSHEAGVGSDGSTTESIATAPDFGVNGNDTLLSISPSTTSRVSERYTTTMQLPLSGFSRLNLILGGDHWRTTGFSWSATPAVLTGNIASVNNLTRNTPGKNGGAFAQGQLSIVDALFLTYGVRVDWNPNFGDKAKVKPGRYGVSYSRDVATPWGAISTKLRGSYGRSIRPPSAGQALALPVTNANVLGAFGPHDSPLANPELGPEHQQGGEGGVELYFGSRASLVVTRYNQTVDNLISRVGQLLAISGPGFDSVRSLVPNPPNGCSSDFRDAEGYCYRYQQKFLNVGSIRNQGWELTGSFNLGQLTTRGTYSWVKSRVLGITPKYRSLLTGSSFEPGRPFNYVPEHTWALGSTYSHANSSLSLSVNGTGMRYISTDVLTLSAGTGPRLASDRPRIFMPTGYRALMPGYFTVDLNAAHQFSSRVDATFQVNNLSNYNQNDYHASFAYMGRQSRLGARIRWQ